MTTGQRIAAKRKAHALSQEGLGETLGVSRQSIYKWECDASLPEIDKLVALSRLFHVSVGWLLGVEDAPEEPAEEQLSQSQMHMIEEIFQRYQHQPTPAKNKWDKRGVRLLFVACGAIVIFMFNLNSKMDRMDSQYGNSVNNLSNSIGNISDNVNSQINSITQRVEEALKAQNSMTADYGVVLTGVDVPKGVLTFTAKVVPKTYVQGMEVVLVADWGDGPVEFASVLGAGQEFTAQLNCPLTDDITISAVLVEGDTRQTQQLDHFNGLYRATIPTVELHERGSLTYLEQQKDGQFHMREGYVSLRIQPEKDKGAIINGRRPSTANVTAVQVGLFREQALLTWLAPSLPPEGMSEEMKGCDFYALPALTFELASGGALIIAARVTDEFGRQFMLPSYPAYTSEEGRIIWLAAERDVPYDPAQWSF